MTSNNSNGIAILSADFLKIIYPVMLGASFSILMSSQNIPTFSFLIGFFVIYVLIVSDYFFSFSWVGSLLPKLKGPLFVSVSIFVFAAIFCLGLLISSTKLILDVIPADEMTSEQLTWLGLPNFWFLIYLIMIMTYGGLIFYHMSKETKKDQNQDHTTNREEFQKELWESFFYSIGSKVFGILLVFLYWFGFISQPFIVILLYIFVNTTQNFVQISKLPKVFDYIKN